MRLLFKVLFVSVVSNVLQSVLCVDIFDIFFGRRLNARSPRDYTRQINHAEKLLEEFGYPFQEHNVTSSDGYIIALHRIPYSKRIRSVKMERPVVLFHHGLLAASDSWLFRGPNKDLTYLLADAGYDVWIINARGNVYSRGHTTLNADKDTSYWKFSFHEMGVYDLPAIIDYVLASTNQKNLYFIGHSMGASVAFVLCSTKPEYNAKIKLISGLAPTAFVVHKLKPFLKLSISILPPLMDSLGKRNITEILPRRGITQEMINIFCRDRSPVQSLCLTVLYLFVGVQNDQLDTTLFPAIAQYYPSGTSLNTFVHYYQTYISGSYRPMDYGKKENMNRYKREIPQDYNISKVTAPVSLHYGDGDFMVTKEDNEFLASKLPNVVGMFRVPYPYFNHLDFMWSRDSKKLLYDPLIKLMNKFR